MENEAYQLNIKDVFSVMQTGNSGLTSKEASARLAKFGLNEIKEKKGISPVTIFINQFKSFIVFILIAAVVVSLAVNEKVDAAVIAIILVINAVLGFIQEYKAEKSIDALKKLTALKSKVLRDNKLMIIDAKELVQGDIILLESGDKIPADSRLVEAYSMETQEASLTGESTPVTKDINEIKSSKAISDQINMVFSGTIVSNGKGRAVVVNTGMKTEIGKIAGMIQETEKHETPLQKKLDVMGRKLGILTIVISIIVFAAGVIQGGEISEIFITAIALAISAIP